jgi:hypothetical protein
MKTLNLLIPILFAAATGCSSSGNAVPVGDSSESPVSIRESLARAGAVLEIDGRKMEVQKLYVQQRTIFAFSPANKPFEMLDSNVLLIGRVELRVNRLAAGVYRLDGDGTITKLADGAQAALIAWNDDKAWIAPKPAKFEPDGKGALGLGVGGL